MPGRRREDAANRVFLNVPYDTEYEPVLVGLTSALIAIGRIPQLTFQIPDGGQGRMPRIFALLRSCRVSFHDLSAVGQPPRFNMPFELGLACAIKAQQASSHDFLILEKKPHRFERHLSDLKGVDAKIHGGKPIGAICAVLEVLDKPGRNPSPAEVQRLYRYLWRLLRTLKEEHGNRSLYSSQIYGKLVTAGFLAAPDVLVGKKPTLAGHGRSRG